MARPYKEALTNLREALPAPTELRVLRKVEPMQGVYSGLHTYTKHDQSDIRKTFDRFRQQKDKDS